MRRRLGCTLCLAAALALAGCGETETGPLPLGELALELVAEGLDQPVFVTAPADDPTRLFVVEKPGRVRVIRDGVLQSDPVLDIAGQTSDGGERGLLSIAFDPDYPVNGHVFANHTDNNGDTRILRFTASAPELFDPNSLEVVLEVDQPFSNHNGGQIAFGPDGMLYVGMGDGGSGGDPRGNGQDLSTLNGALLRIDVSGALPYTIPPSNPFVGSPGAAEEIWAYGLRNPWRFSFDRGNGDIYIGDVGQGDIEEISWAPGSSSGGMNYGWNTLEGSRCYATDPCSAQGTMPPLYEYDHDEGCSVTGGYVYRGSAVPSLQGRYFFADFCDDWIRSLRLVATNTADDVVDHTGDLGPVGGLVSFGEDADGEVYVVSINGVVYRIVAAG